MVRGRSQNGEQSMNSHNGDLAAILTNIQQKLEEQAVIMQQQSAVIHTLQQQQTNGGAVNGGPDNRGTGNEGPRIGETPVGGEHKLERGPQSVIAR